jgi:hypothetical protein
MAVVDDVIEHVERLAVALEKPLDDVTDLLILGALGVHVHAESASWGMGFRCLRTDDTKNLPTLQRSPGHAGPGTGGREV